MEEELQTVNPPPPADLKRSLLSGVLEYIGELIRVVIISLAIILPVRYFLVQPFYVKGASMEPNFHDREYLIIDELSYRLREPSRGEIVVFRYPADPSQFFIKRIIGLPGETIDIQNNKIKVVNKTEPTGLSLEEPYLEAKDIIYGNFSVKLGQNEYYLLGDNRSFSLDSRQFGPVSKQFFIGRAWIRGWPPDRVTRFVAPDYPDDKQNPQPKT